MEKLKNRKRIRSEVSVNTHPFNGSFSGTTQVSRYQKGKTNLDFTEARDCEWQWHQLGHMQVCTSLQTDNHISTPLLSFLQAGCPSCRPTNSVKALKESVSVSIRSISKQSREFLESVRKKKMKATVGRICRKGRFLSLE